MSVKKNKRIEIKNSQKISIPKKKKYLPNALISIIIIGVLAIFIINTFVNKKQRKVHYDIKSENMDILKCIKSPSFPKSHGIYPPYAFDFRQGMGDFGMKIIEYNTGKILKLEGWDKFGPLGLYTIDDEGNIYTSPLPYVSINKTNVVNQNFIVKVDGKNGEMVKFMDITFDNLPTLKNPYGIIGLCYDCTSNSLYASSVAGSTYEKESGKITQINKNSKEIIDELTGIDALGIGIFTGKNGKRLYFGGARKPIIYSLGLNDDGSFGNDIKEEISLLELNNGSFKKAHRIIFNNDEMILKTREFSYTLIAATGEMRTDYKFKYNADADNWELIEMHDADSNLF